MTPSHHDRALTERLIKAGKLIDVLVEDHIIVGSGTRSYFSFEGG